MCGNICGDRGKPLARRDILCGEVDAPSDASASKVGVVGGDDAEVEERRRVGEVEGRPRVGECLSDVLDVSESSSGPATRQNSECLNSKMSNQC